MSRGPTVPHLDFERRWYEDGATWVAGVDEAGVGPLAGPVVAAAVILHRDHFLAGVRDSKALSAERRAELDQHIRDQCVAWAIGIATPEEIDSINVLKATHLAMRRAVLALAVSPTAVLVDGNRDPGLPMPTSLVVKGDALSLTIAAASIVAKTTRDRLMDELDAAYPTYGFRQHKGYPTAAHLAKLDALGPCPAHRRSFAPLRTVAE